MRNESSITQRCHYFLPIGTEVKDDDIKITLTNGIFIKVTIKHNDRTVIHCLKSPREWEFFEVKVYRLGSQLCFILQIISMITVITLGDPKEIDFSQMGPHLNYERQEKHPNKFTSISECSVCQDSEDSSLMEEELPVVAKETKEKDTCKEQETTPHCGETGVCECEIATPIDKNNSLMPSQDCMWGKCVMGTDGNNKN